jgi:5-methylthioadenosine/S-adenosylhomocysteine deaminase
MTTPQPLLIAPDWLIYDSAKPPQAGWAIVVKGDKVLAVGERNAIQAAHPEAFVMEAVGQILTPGFVNAHTHMYGVLAHGIPPAAKVVDFWGFLKDYWWPQVEDALDHTMIRAATDHFCLESVQSGVTTFYDILEAPRALPGCLAAEAEIAAKWGIRAILSFEATQRLSAENGQTGLEENARFIQDCRATYGAHGQLQGLMCFHTTFTCDSAFIRQAFALGEKLDSLVHFHCAEGTFEPDYCQKQFGMRTLTYYDSLGVLGPRAMASQCVQISTEEIALLAERQAAVTSMPLSNCEVGAGFAPLPELDALGVKVWAVMGISTTFLL